MYLYGIYNAEVYLTMFAIFLPLLCLKIWSDIKVRHLVHYFCYKDIVVQSRYADISQSWRWPCGQ